ncbi:AEC family transporter [Spirochaeta dissipatitropha]
MFTYAQPVFHAMLQIFTFLFIGFVLKKSSMFPTVFFTELGRFVVRVALPSYFFVRMSQTDLESILRAVRFPVLAIVVSLIATSIGFLVFRLQRMESSDKKAGIALSGFGNASYLPLSITELVPLSLPLIAEIISIESAIFYIAAFVFMFSPLLWSFGMLFISGGSLKQLHRGFISPPMIGIAAGLLAMLLGIGQYIDSPGNVISAIFPALSRIGDMTIPAILIVLGSMAGGLRIHAENRRELLRLSLNVSGVRFIALPAVFFLIIHPLLTGWGWSITEIWVVFLQFTTAPATNLSVMAAHHGVNEEHTTFTLLFTYMLYLLVFPIYLLIFLQLYGYA